MRPFGATILDADGLRVSADEKAFFRDANPFGFILFARNLARNPGPTFRISLIVLFFRAI